jgi:hypothetical protein
MPTYIYDACLWCGETTPVARGYDPDANLCFCCQLCMIQWLVHQMVMEALEVPDDKET